MKSFFFRFQSMLWLTGVILLLADTVLAQAPTHRVVRNDQLDPNINAFWEYLPRNYTADISTRYPLIIWMHGYGESGIGHSNDVLNLVLNSSIPRMINLNRFPESFLSNGNTYRFIVLSPQIKEGIDEPTRSSKISPAVIDAMIQYAVKTYRIDIGRVYLCGMSMGGGAILDYLGSSNAAAKKIAAAAIACPAADLSVPEADVLGSTGVPLVVAHNVEDKLVYYSRTLASVANLERELEHPTAKPLVIPYTVPSPDEYNHNAWTRSFEHLVPGSASDPNLVNTLSTNVYEWLLKSSTVADALPVTWNNFALRKSSYGVLLEWSVSNQLNVGSYNIQRSSDGINWVQVGTRKPANGNAREWHYQFTDSIEPITAMHYRIQSVDYDGGQGFTAVKTFRPENTRVPQFAIFPNPFVSRITVSFEKQEQRSMVASLISSAGMAVARKFVRTAGDVGRFDLNNTAGLARGLYFLNITTTDGKLLFNTSLIKKD